jgi:hypothetical protein
METVERPEYSQQASNPVRVYRQASEKITIGRAKGTETVERPELGQ